MTTTTSAEQVHATRAEQRRLRLLEAEREQAEEDAQALLITEEQREMLLRPFRGVKAEFQDLDGFRWTEAQLEAHMRGMRSNNNLPHHHHQAAIGAAMGGEGGEGGSDEGGEGEGGGEDDTIRVRARVGEEEGSGETPLGARRHRDGSKARSPVKGLFPPSSPLALAPPALPRPPGLAPAPAYTPYDDATLTRRAGKKRGHESAPGLRLTSPSSRPAVRGPRSAPASGSSLPSGLTTPSPSPAPFPAAAAGPSTTARDGTGQSARARLAALLEHSHALPSYGRQPSSSASAIPPPSPEQTRHPPRTHPALGHPLTRHPSHAPSLRQTRSATSAIPPSPLPSPSPSPSPSPLPTPAPSSPLSHAHSRAPRSGSTSAHPAFRSAYRGSTSTYLPPSSTSLPLSVAYTPLSSSSSSVADATARAAASVSPPSSRAHTHGRAQLSADAPTTHPRPRINPDAHSGGYPLTTARVALTPNVAGLRGWRGDGESVLDDDEVLDEDEALDDEDEDDEEGWCRGCDDVACEDCDDDDEDEECDEDEDCDDDDDCDEECDDDDEDEDEDEMGRGDGDREVLYDDYEHAREGPVVRLPIPSVARGTRGALRAPVVAEDGRDAARRDGERDGGSRGRERLLSTRTIRPLPTRVDARVMVPLDNGAGVGVGAGLEADGEDEGEGAPGRRVERGLLHDAPPTPTPTPSAAVGEEDTYSRARAFGREEAHDDTRSDSRSTTHSESRSRSRSRSRPPTLRLPPGLLPTLSPLQTLPVLQTIPAYAHAHAHTQGHAGARRVYEPEDGEVTPRPA